MYHHIIILVWLEKKKKKHKPHFIILCVTYVNNYGFKHNDSLLAVFRHNIDVFLAALG